MASLKADWTLHVITDRYLSGDRDQVDIIRAAIQGGATVVQLRDKDGPTRDMVGLGRALRRLTKSGI